jgi:hypothetical protein
VGNALTFRQSLNEANVKPASTYENKVLQTPTENKGERVPTGHVDAEVRVRRITDGPVPTIDIRSSRRSPADPSGVYQERGEEVFVGSFEGGSEGTFTTTYNFSSKWEPDVTNGSEVRGRCRHPIVAGSGTGGFEGATGRLDFKDDVVTGEYLWRGHISLR